jgi:hypothetical protein
VGGGNDTTSRRGGKGTGEKKRNHIPLPRTVILCIDAVLISLKLSGVELPKMSTFYKMAGPQGHMCVSESLMWVPLSHEAGLHPTTELSNLPSGTQSSARCPL